MPVHRNSQKRIIVEGHPYFITTITYKREKYFEHPLLAELFISDLRYAESLKQFVLHGYSVWKNYIVARRACVYLTPPAVHLLFTPSSKVNYSEIMRSLKTNFARNVNDIMFHRKENIALEGDVTSRLRREKIPSIMIDRNETFRKCFIEMYRKNFSIPFFKWQKSFHDHIIRDQEDFNHHCSYIYQNAVKYKLVQEPEQWRWMCREGLFLPVQQKRL